MTDTRSSDETGPGGAGATGVVAEIRTWLEENWDPELTVGDWWERLGEAGWSAPYLPAGAYGRGLSRSDSVVVSREIGSFGALGAPTGLGLLLAAPTIAEHGDRPQIDTYVRDIVTGRKAWCQLFSEPGAGSDLAGLTTRAVLDGEEWIINGQKVWTSLGASADLGMLLARTDPDAPKHSGITWMAIDMHQEAVELRPLYEMTGHAMFNEVFLTDARVPVDAVIGDLNAGWAAANTTLANERAGLGAGGGGAIPTAIPGTIAGNLERRAGDFVTAEPKRSKSNKSRGGTRRARSSAQLYIDLAKGNGKAQDPTIRQDLVRLHMMGELGRFNAERVKATRAAGGDVPGMANIAKLAMSDMVRLQRDLGLRIVGAAGTLHAYKEPDKAAIDDATGNPFLAMVTGSALYAQAPPIYGGTDQIQRNIIGERVLGLPKEPGDLNKVPFSELPKNA
ncbi:MAG: acyl-CoA dehydrogenase family protein [Microthrixaceae bacterium]